MVVGVKDVICRRDFPVSCASRMLEGFESRYSATVVERLEAAGAVLVGATNCDEFAMGSSNESSKYGPVRNPVDPERVSGGSSGGSAAAVAAGFCHAALGSDTGGSIRQPAALCGVVGLKPTYGLVSRYGLVAYASSFDSIGPLTMSVEDASLVLQAISGHDPLDSTSVDARYEADSRRPHGDLEGLRIGLPEEYLTDGLQDDVRDSVTRAAAHLQERGATLVETSLPMTEYGIAAYYVLVTAEASSNLARYDGVRYGARARSGSTTSASAMVDSPLLELYERTRSEGFGDEVKRRIMLGTYVLSSGYYDAYYDKAARVRRLIRRDFDRAFEEVDALLTPTTPTTAFRLGEKLQDPLQMYLSDVFTVPVNLAGIPALSVPFGVDAGGLPIGVQVIGPPFQEAGILALGRELEEGAPA
jgi:aspartyl-tRNA(Asn)/glutamyl-tRNA(Gln) amidotransferase subunit A